MQDILQWLCRSIIYLLVTLMGSRICNIPCNANIQTGTDSHQRNTPSVSMDSSNIMLTDVGRLGRRRTRRENSNTTTENVTIHMDRRDRGHNKDNPLENRLSRSDNQSDCKDSATDSDDENDDMNTAIREFRRQQHQKICQQLEQQQPTSLDRSSSQRRPMRHPPNRYIKKCKSATFALDGMLYTIREYCFM